MVQSRSTSSRTAPAVTPSSGRYLASEHNPVLAEARRQYRERMSPDERARYDAGIVGPPRFNPHGDDRATYVVGRGFVSTDSY